MYSGIQNDIDSFALGNALLRNPKKGELDSSFKEIFETTAKQEARKIEEKEVEKLVENFEIKKKKSKEKIKEELLTYGQLNQNQNLKTYNEIDKVYSKLEQFKENKKSFEEEFLNKGHKEQNLNNISFSHQPLIQPVYDNGQRRKMSRSQLLSAWEKFSPTITEDITKKSVRLDIPLLNDIQALVLRINPDKSISVSLLGSQIMGDLIKQNKDRLDRNLRHHHLSLKEFNTYKSELEFNSETGSGKKKKARKPVANKGLESVFI